MAKKPSIRELRAHLARKTPPELIEEIVTLYSRYESVKEFYMAQLQGGYSEELLDRYKAIITKEFFPSDFRPGPGRIAIARRAVLDYKKLAASPVSVADIMLHYVEIGVAYTRQFGDIDAPFYASVERMYETAIKHILASNLEGQFQERCTQIMRQSDGFGWGFSDTMMEIYYTYFETDDEPDEE